MPYHEGKEQAHLYFDIAETQHQKKFSSALSNFNLALAIASNNNMKDLVTLCKACIASLPVPKPINTRTPKNRR
jgi:hypothetical protein